MIKMFAFFAILTYTHMSINLSLVFFDTYNILQHEGIKWKKNLLKK
jgi:hypothetical protein